MVPSILFVCLGNICRSPLAEAAFREEARRLQLDAVTNSAGTGNWHIGSPPDPRAQAVALKNGVDISGLRGRQVKPADFRRFTHLVAIDHDNLANLRRIAPPDATAKLSLLLDHVEGRAGQAVADPYYGEEDGFDVTWADVTDGARALAVKLLRHKI
ncbi:low molecular weight protein-tyrosine-phosphatase [Brevundimonas naejangsanensis]|uniref:low molecular weight protein-tyrosine-phosphatase n=1 Tax=Brevundimonas naejangsanensis TaxID=588932 RepID=UPI0026EDFC1F|nr:low molecular weight protein-tyrosine-phosphatase [Brevundimonas naejangsanensis]